MKKITALLLLLSTWLLMACTEQEHFSFAPMRHAQLLRWQEGEGWTGVEVMDAWHEGQVAQRYLLVPHDAPLPADLPEGLVVRTPLRRTVLLSAVHGALMADLHCLDQVAGLCDAEYIQDRRLLAGLQAQQLANLGSSMTINAEAMMAAAPDAFFVSPFENAGYGQLETMKVPLIICADYMETSALGRAEWMKFYGRLMGKGEAADSLFAAVETNYLTLCQQAQAVTARPSLLCDLKQGSAWYVPGGKSYLGQLFADAGANYLFAAQAVRGSAALSLEQVYATGREADYWLVKYGRQTPYSYGELAKEDPRYSHFKPWKERRILGCNTLEVPYYEEVPFHPDRLLDNLIRLFHPGLLPPTHTPDSLPYYRPMAE